MRRRRLLSRAARRWSGYSRFARSRTERPGAELGFTLIELIIVIAIIPLVVGGISVALISVISQQTTASTKVSDTGDTTLLSSVFTKDVQSAQFVTTKASVTSPSPCNTSSPIVSLQWPSTNTVVVSYAVIKQSGSSKYSLYRYYCQGLVFESKIVAYNVQGSLTADITGKSCTPFPPCSLEPAAAAAGWTSTAGTETVTLDVKAPEKTGGGSTTYGYTLVGVPRVSNNFSRGSTISPGHAPLLMLGSGSPGVTCVGHDTITVNGTAAINSTSNPAVQTNGNGGFSATTLYTDGPSGSGATSGNNITITSGSVTPGVHSADPYADANGNILLTPPDSNGLPVYNSGNYSGPGVYTKEMKLVANSDVILASGIYIFDNGLSISGGANVTTATGGVFFYVAGGSVSITGSGTITLDPMDSPPAPAPNLVIWQVASDANAMTLGGNGGALSIGGTIYAPNVSLGAGGNGTLNVGSLVADSLSCNGGGNSGQIIIGNT